MTLPKNKGCRIKLGIATYFQKTKIIFGTTIIIRFVFLEYDQKEQKG